MSNKVNLNPDLLAVSTRDNLIETLHYGWVCLINKNKEITYKIGNINNVVFLRSAAKPVQAIAVLENQVEVVNKELALICASHSGSSKHLSIIKKFMNKHNIHLADLQCGIHMPFDDTQRNNLIKHNLKANPLHNNCSGKHLGMLVTCKKNNWDIKSYLNSDHPIQKINLKNIQELSETKMIKTGVDGCGVPTFALPVINISYMFSNFTYRNNKFYKKIIASMTKNPFYVGGKDQIDTLIMERTKGRLLSKVGANGIIIVANRGNVLVVKIADGSSQIRSFVTINLLVQFKWLNKKEIQGSNLEKILTGEITNHNSKRVGEMVFKI